VRKFRRTTLITAGCTAVLAGLGLSRKLQITPQIWWLIFTPLFLLLKSKNFTSLIVICLLGLGLGMWRGGIYMQRLHVLQDYSLQKVTIQATATSDSVYSTKSQIQFTANNVQLIAPKNQPLAGSFKLSGFGEHMIYRGDRVQVTGKLYPTRGAN